MIKNEKIRNLIKIAVTGGGIFGVTTAVKLAKRGFRVDLFEKEPDILRAASGINQFRLHRGYHYPRSQETMRDCLRTEQSFLKEYGKAVISDEEHYYCIAREGSFVSAKEHKEVWRKSGLTFAIAKPDLVNHEKLELTVRGEEKRIDPTALRKICWRNLKNNHVNVKLKETATKSKLKKYDFTIIAT